MHVRRAWPNRPSGSRLLAGLSALVVGAVAWLGLATALSPVRLAEVGPADGAALVAPPAEVGVRFTRVVNVGQAHLTVATDTGQTVASAVPQPRGTWLVTPVNIGKGAYLLVYHVVLADGHVFEGVTRFVVEQGGTTQAITEPGHVHSDDPFSIVLTLVAAVFVLVMVLILVWGPRKRRSNNSSRDIEMTMN